MGRPQLLRGGGGAPCLGFCGGEEVRQEPDVGPPRSEPEDPVRASWLVPARGPREMVRAWFFVAPHSRASAPRVQESRAEENEEGCNRTGNREEQQRPSDRWRPRQV